MLVKVSTLAFNPWQEVANYQQHNLSPGKYGATSVFVGTMRDFNQGDGVQAMVLDYYPGMVEKQIHYFIEQANQQWQLLNALVIHRVGQIQPDDSLVVVAVWSVHRGDAFDACRYIMEKLKHHAPFWKKECLVDGSTRWVTKNTDGYGLNPGNLSV